MDIVERTLNEQADVYAEAREEYRRVIQQQRDEIERLRWENANMEKLWGASEGTWMEIRDKQDAEIERLRNGLEHIVEIYDHHVKTYDHVPSNVYLMAKIARSALEGEK